MIGSQCNDFNWYCHCVMRLSHWMEYKFCIRVKKLLWRGFFTNNLWIFKYLQEKWTILKKSNILPSRYIFRVKTTQISRSAAEGGTLVALRIGTNVANRTKIQPPNTTIKIVDQGSENAAPCSSQNATYRALWNPTAMITPFNIPNTATQETSIKNDCITILFR